jgi:hypothetical protein
MAFETLFDSDLAEYEYEMEMAARKEREAESQADDSKAE